MGTATTALSQRRSMFISELVILSNVIIKVSTVTGRLSAGTVILATSSDSLYAVGLVTSVCLLIIMVHSFAFGIVSSPYLPAFTGLPPTVTSSPKVIVVAS